MRVYVVTSVHLDAGELAGRQRRYDQISPPGVTVELHNIGSTAPRVLETHDDIRNSARLVAAALRAVDDLGYDVLLPDGVLDPAVDELADALATPVYGQLRLTLDHVAVAAGAVVLNEIVAGELTDRAAAYCTPLAATSIVDVEHTVVSADTRWLAALSRAVNELAEAGAEAVINGTAAGALDNVRSGRVPVVDPAAAALRQLVSGGADD